MAIILSFRRDNSVLTAARPAGAAAVGKEVHTIITEQYNAKLHYTVQESK